jgi:hypothetical protein
MIAEEKRSYWSRNSDGVLECSCGASGFIEKVLDANDYPVNSMDIEIKGKLYYKVSNKCVGCKNEITSYKEYL